MSLEDEVRRGGKAQELLNNEIFTDAVKAIEEALLLGIRQSAFKDEALREKLCHRYSLLHDLVAQIATTMETGQLAEEQVKQSSIAERVKGFFHINQE